MCGNNLFSCDGRVEVPNFKGPLRDQRFNFGLPPDRLVERLLEGGDVTPLFEDQEDLLPPGSQDGEDVRSCILGVYLRLHSFQDLGVGLSVLRRDPVSLARAGARELLGNFPFALGFCAEGTGTFFFFFSFSSFFLLHQLPFPILLWGLASGGRSIRWRCVALPFLWKPILRGRRNNPLLPLCQIFWGISQRRRAQSPGDTHLF